MPSAQCLVLAPSLILSRSPRHLPTASPSYRSSGAGPGHPTKQLPQHRGKGRTRRARNRTVGCHRGTSQELHHNQPLPCFAASSYEDACLILFCFPSCSAQSLPDSSFQIRSWYQPQRLSGFSSSSRTRGQVNQPCLLRGASPGLPQRAAIA